MVPLYPKTCRYCQRNFRTYKKSRDHCNGTFCRLRSKGLKATTINGRRAVVPSAFKNKKHTTPCLTEGPDPVYAVSDETNSCHFTVVTHRPSTGPVDFSYCRGVSGQSTLTIPAANLRRVGVGDATTLAGPDMINLTAQTNTFRLSSAPGLTEREIGAKKKIADGGLGGDLQPGQIVKDIL